MSATPGWYPDPGGQPSMFRYWDGQTWSANVSAQPGATPGAPPTRSASRQPAAGSFAPQPAPRTGAPQSTQRRGRAWLIGLIAVALAVIVAIALVVRRADDYIVASGPSGQSSTDVCPKPQSASPDPQRNDSRVHAGKLSAPRLGAPWSAPIVEDRVAFGKGVLQQYILIEPNTSKSGEDWFAVVMIGDLVAGDGFFSPQDGAAIVVKCVAGTFYGDSAVTRDDQRNEAIQVDGHDGWIIESQLGFDVPGIKAKSERLIVAIIDTGGGTAGLFYASIPENAEQHLPMARRSLADLRVEP